MQGNYSRDFRGLKNRNNLALRKVLMTTIPIANRAVSSILIGLVVYTNTAKSFDLQLIKKGNHKMQKLWLGLGEKVTAYSLPYLP